MRVPAYVMVWFSVHLDEGAPVLSCRVVGLIPKYLLEWVQALFRQEHNTKFVTTCEALPLELVMGVRYAFFIARAATGGGTANKRTRG